MADTQDLVTLLGMNIQGLDCKFAFIITNSYICKMILEKELFKAGKINKTHGVNGELNCSINSDTIDRAEYMVLDMDGIFVPFFISNIRVKSQNAVLVTLEDIEDETEARKLIGKDVYLPISLMEEEDMLSYEYFVGFTVVNAEEKLGEISFVDDQTVNILFGIKTDDGEILLPAVEDFIEEVDNENKILYTNYPIELVELNKNS